MLIRIRMMVLLILFFFFFSSSGTTNTICSIKNLSSITAEYKKGAAKPENKNDDVDDDANCLLAWFTAHTQVKKKKKQQLQSASQL